jgi:hypothetical protein
LGGSSSVSSLFSQAPSGPPNHFLHHLTPTWCSVASRKMRLSLPGQTSPPRTFHPYENRKSGSCASPPPTRAPASRERGRRLVLRIVPVAPPAIKGRPARCETDLARRRSRLCLRHSKRRRPCEAPIVAIASPVSCFPVSRIHRARSTLDSGCPPLASLRHRDGGRTPRF